MNDKQSVVDAGMATSAEETKIAAGKSPSGVRDRSQHSLEGTEPFAAVFFRRDSLPCPL